MTIWGQELPPVCDQVLRLSGLGSAVCADGANGLTRVSRKEAQARGIFAPPDWPLVPLVAYHAEDSTPRAAWLPSGRLPFGLDDPKNMTGVIMLQGEFDPYPGAYMSATALQDSRFPEGDAHRYFDSAALPGWVVPGALLKPYGVQLGDLAAVSYGGRTVWCQAYDVGPTASKRIELSVEACRQLGIPDCARSGGTDGGVSVAILPGSRTLTSGADRVRPWSRADVNQVAAQAAKLLQVTK